MSFVDLPSGLRLFVTDDAPAAPQGPALVLVHGVGGDSNDWIWQLGPLGARHRVIAPDLRGHGASSVPDEGYRPDDYAGDLVALLERLDPAPGKVVLVGHSLGAVVASNLAADRPDLLAGAVLLDPTYGDADALRGPVADLIGRLVRTQDAAAIEAALAARAAADTPEPLARWHRRRTLATPGHVLAGTLGGLHDGRQPMHRPEVDDALRRRAVPLLVLHAQEGKAAWERSLQSDPRSRVMDWEGRGHWMHHDDPATVNALVLDWLASL